MQRITHSFTYRIYTTELSRWLRRSYSLAHPEYPDAPVSAVIFSHLDVSTGHYYFTVHYEIPAPV